jgi:hypothetical protein
VVTKTEGQGDEEGTSLEVQGVRSNFLRCLFTILNYILTVGGQPEAKSGLPGLTLTQEAT